MDSPRHLFVDGYNVLHAWRWLSASNTRGAEFQNARERLIETVRVMHDVDRFDVTIVFDGRGSATAEDAAAMEAGFTVLYAPADRTADGVIEALVAAHAEPRRCVVVTADHLERETVTAAGASCLSPDDLAAWCERSRARVAGAAARRAGKDHRGWGNKLPL